MPIIISFSFQPLEVYSEVMQHFLYDGMAIPPIIRLYNFKVYFLLLSHLRIRSYPIPSIWFLIKYQHQIHEG